MGVDITVTLTTHTCRYGHLYAVPHWVTELNHTCPMCAKEQVRSANQQYEDELQEDIKKDRTIAALRGALTKAKRFRGKP